MQVFDKMIRLKPDDAVAYSNRGIALKDLGQLESAVDSYSRAIQLQPNYAQAYTNRGKVLQELGQL